MVKMMKMSKMFFHDFEKQNLTENLMVDVQ